MKQKEAAELLEFALNHNLAGVLALSDVREYLVETTRGEDGVRYGTVTHEIPDVIVKSLKGPPDKASFHLIMIAIPKWVEDRAKSPIVTPGEVAMARKPN